MSLPKIPVAVVVTSIARPNAALRSIAAGCAATDTRFLVIGDSRSPPGFEIDGCEFYSIQDQLSTGLKYAQLCPEKNYARKNIGYLLAIKGGARVLVETDDDNYPGEAFWGERRRLIRARCIQYSGWTNVYGYFADVNIWPRGLPLAEVRKPLPRFEDLPIRELDCPIQQGLADENPDVDAVYRLVMPLPQHFRADRRLILGRRAWCPFNSQNTTWWEDAFPLMYLPAYCSFRMTDIWRSFVAQCIAWTNGWSILFHEPTVRQERNDHNLMRDFEDEIPGYLLNGIIGEALDKLSISPGRVNIAENLRKCYQSLIEVGAVNEEELSLLDAWLEDIGQIYPICSKTTNMTAV